MLATAPPWSCVALPRKTSGSSGVISSSAAFPDDSYIPRPCVCRWRMHPSMLCVSATFLPMQRTLGELSMKLIACYDVDYWHHAFFPWQRWLGWNKKANLQAGYSARRLRRLFDGFIEHRVHKRQLPLGGAPRLAFPAAIPAAAHVRPHAHPESLQAVERHFYSANGRINHNAVIWSPTCRCRIGALGRG